MVKQALALSSIFFQEQLSITLKKKVKSVCFNLIQVTLHRKSLWNHYSAGTVVSDLLSKWLPKTTDYYWIPLFLVMDPISTNPVFLLVLHPNANTDYKPAPRKCHRQAVVTLGQTCFPVERGTATAQDNPLCGSQIRAWFLTLRNVL